ncbi:MAG: peptidylprolyl isomerase [Gammaproteobacteria bacterium]|nr:peptidylprolyl isomerase [Gammaproteobacteria bacterium]
MAGRRGGRYDCVFFTGKEIPVKRLLIALFLNALLVGTAAAANNPRVSLDTSLGEIVVELDPAKAPKTVENFLQYVRDGHYDGTIFHRVIDGFMIQGGGFTADMEQKPTRGPIMNEADNGLRNAVGTIAMARTNDPHSATAQFFINVANNSGLDFREKTPRAWGYAVFGRVVEGMGVVGQIKSAPTTSVGPFQDVPREPIVIRKATLLPDSAN